ncbi:hypothetical protein M431DRAFT_470688 [Trichoderma harzianum CBS 226.95]|uniref:Uncharacterized protein n=1 Tax=Trichoderma harzianum CBS 226.95 TaxID=983964 RepID=A0A2T4A6P9_TRIHA|nr:hypothetical protein M431DRAFT_470688 [Trichoderma harzianum CBS 226.95]PTB52740.1 hypothetical protein M431DRAFT_470688 [Trichoderma harzianum CBS 226.95]
MVTSCCYHWHLLADIRFPKYLLPSRYSSGICYYSHVPLVSGILIINAIFPATGSTWIFLHVPWSVTRVEPGASR